MNDIAGKFATDLLKIKAEDEQILHEAFPDRQLPDIHRDLSTYREKSFAELVTEHTRARENTAEVLEAVQRHAERLQRYVEADDKANGMPEFIAFMGATTHADDVRYHHFLIDIAINEKKEETETELPAPPHDPPAMDGPYL